MYRLCDIRIVIAITAGVKFGDHEALNYRGRILWMRPGSASRNDPTRRPFTGVSRAGAGACDHDVWWCGVMRDEGGRRRSAALTHLRSDSRVATRAVRMGRTAHSCVRGRMSGAEMSEIRR